MSASSAGAWTRRTTAASSAARTAPQKMVQQSTTAWSTPSPTGAAGLLKHRGKCFVTLVLA